MTYPMPRRRRTGSEAVVARPWTSTSPEVGKSRPLTIFSAVVLPEPLRPSSTTVSPGSMASERRDRISRPPIRYETSRNSTIALIGRRSFRQEQRFDERPLGVGPLAERSEPGRFRPSRHFPGAQLAAGFGPDGLALVDF